MPDDVIAAIRAAPQMPAHAEWRTAGAKDAGSWGDVLGESAVAHEAFMAHAYARHIEAVASAGRESFPIPLFVNAWLNNPPGEGYAAEVADSDPVDTVALAGGAQPGSYPSGGPLPRVAPIWTATAPSLDFLAPDIYFGDAATIMARVQRGRRQAAHPGDAPIQYRCRPHVPGDRSIPRNRSFAVRRRLAATRRPRRGGPRGRLLALVPRRPA